MNSLKMRNDILKNVNIIIDQINIAFLYGYKKSSTKYHHIIWLNDEFYYAGLLCNAYKLIVNLALNDDELSSNYIFHKDTKITFRNKYNNEMFDPFKENKFLYYKFLNSRFGYYSLVRKKDINHKLYINDMQLLDHVIYYYIDNYTNLFKEKIIFKEFYTYMNNEYVNLSIEFINNTNTLHNINLIISKKYNFINEPINKRYYQITEFGYNKKINAFKNIANNLSDKLNSMFDQPVKFNIKMYNKCYDIKNYSMYAVLDYLNEEFYFMYEK